MNEHEFKSYFRIEKINEDKRIVEASISSEYPYHRPGQGDEVLIHENSSIDLSRGPELPVVIGHDWKPENVGIAYDFRLKGKKLYATLKFGFSKRASDIWTDIKAGILKFISISYDVLKKTKPNSQGRYFVTKWRPLEVSLVSVAADPTVGIGRSKQNDRTKELRNYFSESKGNKKMKMNATEKQLHEKFERNQKYWLKDQKFENFAEFLQAVKAQEEIAYQDPRLRASGLSTAKDGNMVGTDFSLQMISAPNAPEQWLRAMRVLLGKNTNSVKMPTFAEESRATDSIIGGVRFYYVAEADEKTASQFKLRALVEDLIVTACLIYGTDELFSDTQLGSKVIPAAVQMAWNAMIVEGITTGSGAGRPLGILNAGCTVTVQPEGGQDAGTVLAENIDNMLKHLPPENWQSPGLCWQVHKDAIPQLSTLTKSVGTGGTRAAMWHWREGGEKFNKLCGIDVIVNPYCPSINERGTIILSDMREYVICHKESKETTSMHVRFIYGEQAYRMVFRWDGQPAWSKAVTPAEGSNKISPFIVLGERS